MFRGARGEEQLFDSPGLPSFGIAVNGCGSEAVKHGVIGRVTGDELPLQMRGKLGDNKFVARGDGGDFVTVGFAFGGAFQIEQAPIPRRDLNGYVAETRGPGADGVESVERRGIAGELGQEDAWALNRFLLRRLPLVSWQRSARPGSDIHLYRVARGRILPLRRPKNAIFKTARTSARALRELIFMLHANFGLLSR